MRLKRYGEYVGYYYWGHPSLEPKESAEYVDVRYVEELEEKIKKLEEHNRKLRVYAEELRERVGTRPSCDDCVHFDKEAHEHPCADCGHYTAFELDMTKLPYPED